MANVACVRGRNIYHYLFTDNAWKFIKNCAIFRNPRRVILYNEVGQPYRCFLSVWWQVWRISVMAASWELWGTTVVTPLLTRNLVISILWIPGLIVNCLVSLLRIVLIGQWKLVRNFNCDIPVWYSILLGALSDACASDYGNVEPMRTVSRSI